MKGRGRTQTAGKACAKIEKYENVTASGLAGAW